MSVKTSPSGVKTTYNTANPFEKRYGYHRAVRKGPFISVAGTTAYSPTTGELLHPGDAGGQTKAALEIAINAVKTVGGKGAQDVVRVRMFIQAQSDAPAVAEAYSAILGSQLEGGEIGAAMTLLIVGKEGFFVPEMMVEVEVDAITD